ncbi:MAG: hypothetical protein ACPHM2_08875 [Alcanivorax sp.]
MFQNHLLQLMMITAMEPPAASMNSLGGCSTPMISAAVPTV